MILQILLLAEVTLTTTAFLSTTTTTTRSSIRTRTTSTSTTTNLNGHISEWRDLMFDPPEKLLDETYTENSADREPVREVCILPFPMNDVLLQGETKELCLYEERFHKLFEKATTEHAGIVAMGYIAPPSGMLQGMPICEIENFRTMEGDTGFGDVSILATIRVVGRATLLDVQSPDGGDLIEGGYMTGWCTEFMDDMSNIGDGDLMEVYNELADKCEDLFESIISLQETLSSLEEEKQKEAMKESGIGGGDKEVLSEATLKRMKLEAELGLDDDDDDDEDDDDDYLDDDDDDSSARSTFQKAVQIAKASDTQGYTILSFGDSNSDIGELSSPSTTSTKTSEKRSIQDLTALSWAYLSKDVWGEDEDDDENTLLKYRLQALNTVDLSDRFILVSKMLIEQKAKLFEKREKL